MVSTFYNAIDEAKRRLGIDAIPEDALGAIKQIGFSAAKAATPFYGPISGASQQLRDAYEAYQRLQQGILGVATTDRPVPPAEQQVNLGLFTIPTQEYTPQALGEQLMRGYRGLTGEATYDPQQTGFARQMPEGRAREAAGNINAMLLDPITLATSGFATPIKPSIVLGGILGSEAAGQTAESFIPSTAPDWVRKYGPSAARLAGGVIGPAAAVGAERVAQRATADITRQALAEAAGPAYRSAYTESLGTAVPGERVGSTGTRFARRVAGGAPFTEDEIAAQQAHIQRQVASDENLTSAIAKIQDNLAQEEALRARGGVAEREIAAGRAEQAGRTKTAQEIALANNLTLEEASRLASEGARIGRLRQTLPPGADLTTEESRAISRLLATSPALQGKELTWKNYVKALDDFLKGESIQPEQRKRLSDLLGINLEIRQRGSARGARPPGEPAMYPARMWQTERVVVPGKPGVQERPVPPGRAQTFRNEPQQEIAGRVRIIGSDGQVKEGVIQPSLFEPDKYMLVDPDTGVPIPDYRPDGTPIPGSAIRSTSTAARSPGPPQQFPEPPVEALKQVQSTRVDQGTGHPVVEDALIPRPPEPPVAISTPAEEAARLARDEQLAAELRAQMRAKKKRPPLDWNPWNNVKDALTGVRTIWASGEISPTGRQARRTILAYNKQWRAAVKDELDALVHNEGRAWEISERIDTHPYRRFWEEMKLDLPDPVSYNVSKQEEMFMHGSTPVARAIERVPGVARTERAVAVFMKSLRAGIANYFIDKVGGYEKMLQMPAEDKLAMGKLVNAMTGRGSLPKVMQEHAQLPNAIFFSPRNQVANVQVPATVIFGRSSDALGRTVVGVPRLRYEAAKTLVSDVASKWALRGVLIAAGAKVGVDINSSDWGKIILPNGERIDMDGGDLQMERLIANISSGGTTSVEGIRKDERIIDIVGRYLMSKFAPIPSEIAKTYISGKPVEFTPEKIGKEALHLATSLWIQDIADALYSTYRQAGAPAALGAGALTAVASGIGVGSNINQSDVVKNIVNDGRYHELPARDKFNAIDIEAWRKIKPVSGASASPYESYHAWRADQLEKLTKQFIDLGMLEGDAELRAKKVVSDHPISQAMSGVASTLKDMYVIQNTTDAARLLDEEKDLPWYKKTFIPTQAQLNAITVTTMKK